MISLVHNICKKLWFSKALSISAGRALILEKYFVYGSVLLLFTAPLFMLWVEKRGCLDLSPRYQVIRFAIARNVTSY